MGTKWQRWEEEDWSQRNSVIAARRGVHYATVSARRGIYGPSHLAKRGLNSKVAPEMMKTLDFDFPYWYLARKLRVSERTISRYKKQKKKESINFDI